MMAVLSSKRDRYVGKFGIFLIAVALIVGMEGCGGPSEGGPYNLTIDSTAGGSVITPGEGTFNYDGGTVVDLVAEAEEGYRFVNWTGDVDTIADVWDATTNITMDDNYSITANFEPEHIPMVAAGYYHTVGVKADGTVVAVGFNGFGECDVGNWTDIVQVAAADGRTVGLKASGTVVAAGGNYYGQCNVGNWTNITQVAVGYNNDGQCNVGNWTNITQVAAGYIHTVGVSSNCSLVAVGYNDYGQCNVGNWTNITQVAAGYRHTVGLKSDGTVVAVGDNGDGQCDVGGWMLN